MLERCGSLLFGNVQSNLFHVCWILRLCRYSTTMNTLSSSENWRTMLLSWRLHYFKMTSSYSLNTLGEDQSNQLSQFTIERTFSTFYLKLKRRWYFIKRKTSSSTQPICKRAIIDCNNRFAQIGKSGSTRKSLQTSVA